MDCEADLVGRLADDLDGDDRGGGWPIYVEGEESACRRFCSLRWPETDDAPICARLATASSARRRGTIFASHKLGFVDLLAAIRLVVNASKCLSAVQLSRDPNVQHKTAIVLMHKLREAMAFETRDAMLVGEIEVDGAAVRRPCPPLEHTGGSCRPLPPREATREGTTPPLTSSGIDIGKGVFHVVGFDPDGKIAFRRKIRRLAVSRPFNRGLMSSRL
jgi:hypothetical protein